jgi:hypothetical protein
MRDNGLAKSNQRHLEICRMRFGLLQQMLAGAMVLSLLACEKPPAPVHVAPPPPPASPPPVRRSASAIWTFHSSDVCTASASSNALTLDVTASSSVLTLSARMGRGTLMPVGRSVAIEFAGTAGNWKVTGRKTSWHRLIASQPMTEDQAGQILLLLQGGVVRVGTPEEDLPPLQVPNSGVPGRDWFECVRRQLFP